MSVKIGQPAKQDIVIVRGKALEFGLALRDSTGASIDCTGWDANMQVATAPLNEGGTLISSARCLNADGNVTVGTISQVGDPANGDWHVFIPAHLHEGIPVGDQAWDIDFIPQPGEEYKRQYIYGTAVVLNAITVL